MNKSKVTGSFRRTWYGLYFSPPFYFSLLLSIGKRSTLAKIWGVCSPPSPPGFYGPVFTSWLVSHQVCIHMQYFFGVIRNKLQKQSLEVFCKKDVLKNFAKSTGKHLCQSLFFKKVAGLSNFIKKETLAQVFSCKFCENFKNIFCTEHLWTTASLDDCFWNFKH